MLTLDYVCTIADFEAYLIVMRDRIRFTRSRQPFILVIIVVVACFWLTDFFLSTYSPDLDRRLVVWLPALTLIAGAIIGSLAQYISQLRDQSLWLKRALSGDSLLFGPMHLTANRHTLTIEHNGTLTAIFDWSAFKEITIDEDNLILWSDHVQGVFIPRRAFGETNDKLEQMIDLSGLKKTKIKWKPIIA